MRRAYVTVEQNWGPIEICDNATMESVRPMFLVVIGAVFILDFIARYILFELLTFSWYSAILDAVTLDTG